MKTYISFLLLILLYAEIASAQADAGSDKTVSTGNGTTIGKPGNPTWCYHWEALPADPALKKDVAQPLVNPSQTTKYTLTVTGPDFSFISTDEVTVFKFGFNYFRYTVGKDWKVVVGKPIEFDAEASSDCTDWDWDMEDGFPDTWNPVGGNIKSGTSIKIPNSDLEDAEDNNWLGEKYGTLTVSCKDKDGSNHKISSTEVNPFTKIKVYFSKDEYVHDNGKLPNWFFYWKQFIPMDRINKLIFDNSLSGYGVTNPQTRVTTISQKASEYNDETGHYGLHTFYETIAHESYHITLWEGWWGVGGSPDPADDTDNDTYPDSWERTDPGAIAAGFIVGVNDTYNGGGPGVPSSAGYIYEEQECRNVEHNLSESTYDSFDWSFDPAGTNQGKQW